jgi:glycosyltransferase involved in cell wall biosynthesis
VRVALVSRELYPFGGGGIGEYVNACARLLSGFADVTVFTSSAHRGTYRKLRAKGDNRLVPDEVEMVFVPEACEEDRGGYFSTLHVYSARVFESLREHYAGRGPDLVEFSDYLAEGAVTVQARRARDPLLRRSVVAIRLHTTAEVCAVLDGHIEDDFAARITCELERLAIRDADCLVWPGGDTLGLYHRFYGAEQVAPGTRIRYPMMDSPDAQPPMELGCALRLLYLGRLERRKGVHNLLRALNFIDREDLRVDILGADTDTGPLGTSVAAQLQMMTTADSRVHMLGSVARDDVPAAIRAANCVVLPSLWENWPYSGLEALRGNRPIVAAPVGGFTEMVKPDASGWHTKDATTGALVDRLEQLLRERDRLVRLVAERRPAGVFAALTDPAEITEAYRALMTDGGRWSESGAPAVHSARWPTSTNGGPPQRKGSVAMPRTPLISVIIPYYRLADYIEESVASALVQTYPRVEVIVVNDGSNSDADWVLAEVAARYPIAVVTQLNSGLGAARNFGISQARGHLVIPLDADNVLGSTFVERTVQAMAANPDAAYVTTWSRYIDEAGEPLAPPDLGYQPIGNASDEVLRNNVAGDAVALLRRRLFDAGFSYSEDLTSYEDWLLYQQLHVAGYHGIVVPERLFQYRVREASMIRQIGFPQTGRLSGELRAHLREGQIQWVQQSD